MTPDGVAVAVMIILLFPMGYFTLASPAFLLVKLDIAPVAQLLRGMFNAHFLVMRVAGIIGTIAFLLDGRLVAAAGVGLLATLAMWGRRWFLQRMDDQLSATEAGDTEAPRRCAGCIGAECWRTRCCLPFCWPAFPISPCRLDRRRITAQHCRRRPQRA